MSEELEVSARTLTYWESGEKDPGQESQRKMARALRVPVEFLHGDDLDEIGVKGASFRSLSKMTKRQSDAVLAVGAIAFTFSRLLEQEFELPEAALPDAREDGNPHGAAEEIRAVWGLGERPVGNLVHLLESKGVRVFSLPQDHREVDAFSLWNEGRPFIFLNTLKSAERGRFDAAHELGHLVLHRHDEIGGREAEKEANEFASAFLMPEKGTLARAPFHPSVRGIVEGKKVWGVSTMAFAYRLHRLDHFSDWHYHALMRRMSSLGYRTEEPNARPRETSQLLHKVFSVWRQEGVSRTDIARRLHLFRADLDRLVFNLVLTVVDGDGSGSQGEEPPHRLRLVKE